MAEWEGGLSYPKAERLKQLITLGVRASAFAVGREEEEIHALWRAAHQKVLLDERWLHNLVGPPVPIQLFPQAETRAPHPGEEPAAFPRVDWVGALDVSHFAGREVEVAELTQWILEERCRLVTLLGMGGIGKSTLASYLGQHLAPQFEAVLWRSVRDAPACSDLVADCITFFSETPPAAFPASLEQCLNQLLARLQARRCLLVLDNLETLLASGDRAGNYLAGYEGYGRLIRRLAESAHQSCVLLTSREKPKEIEPLEGMRSPVRSLLLVGMDEAAAQELLIGKGLSGTPAAWQRLVTSYAGNPLALKIVAQAISDLFSGDLDRFLHEGELIFNGIRPVLRQQMGRLTPLEHLLLTWLAVLREWTELPTLSQVLHPRVLRAQLLEALEALGRRSLLERGQQAAFSLQSVVMEYLTDALGERLGEEIVRGTPQQLRNVALSQAQAKDYVRQTQVRLLVQPLLERLRAELGGDSPVEARLLRLLAQFRAETDAAQGYGPANVLSLLTALRGHLRGLDLSGLFMRGAYLQGVEMQDTNLSRSHLHETIFTEAFDAVLSVAVSPDGRYIAAGSNSGQVRVWREEGRVAHLTMRGHSDRVGAIAFSPDGQTLATASWDGTVRIWDVESGATIWTGGDDGVLVSSLAIGPSGKLVSGSYDEAIHLASGGLDAVIRLWDSEGGTLLQELHGHRDVVCKLAFAPGPETSLLASGSYDQAVKLWDVESGACRRTLEGHTGVVPGLAFSPDGRTLASASYDTTIRLWDRKTGQCRHILQGHRDAVISVAFLPTGDRLLSASFDRTVRTWDVQSGQHVHTMAGYALALYALAWSPDGRFLVSSSSEATLTLWDVPTRALVLVLRGHRQGVYAVAWSRAGNRIASGSVDHTVRIWDMQEGASRVGSEHTGVVNAVVWYPDGMLVASAAEDGMVLVWRATDGDLLRRFEHAGPVLALCWSPNGEQLVSGVVDGAKGVVSLWDVRQGTLVRTLEGHRGFIMGVEWSRAYDLLVSAGADGTLRWWNPEQGVPRARVQAHEAWARAVRVSPDGKTVASCGEDGVIQLWDMQSHKHLATLRADRPYERLDISGTLGLTNAQQAALRALGASSADNATPPLF